MASSFTHAATLVFDQMFVGPLWPASILICLMIAYTCLAIIGLIDFGFDVPEVDVDTPELDVPTLDAIDIDAAALESPDADVVPVDSDFLQGLGAATIRWTNFGRVPVVIWGGAFTVSYWMISYILWHGFDTDRYQPVWFPSTLLALRNLVLSVMATKVITQPLVRFFVAPPSYTQHTIIGATCEVCTTEVTPHSGQAKFRTNAAPLLLNVRTDGPHIPKGQEVRIIGFHNQEKRIYQVTPLDQEPQS